MDSDRPQPPTTVQVASNLGPDRLWRLRLWATQTAQALGCESAILHGSSLHSKDWRDLDVRFTFPNAKWTQVGHAWTGDAWWVLCSGLSAHASSVVGAAVDAQVTTRPDDGYVLWEAESA